MKKQSGFTLIELVMVIVILGALAVAALPKFVDLKSDAQAAALQGVAGALSSAFAVNYAARSAKGTATGVTVDNCNITTVLQGGLPSGYSVAASAVTTPYSGSCTLTQTATNATTSYTVIAID
ncbi:type II secretion system protein [Rhizobacter sp. OV335]|uniref:type II secretion system protein n=1 Tax=Rhizobacter sp. OV335 TaxID=1500264 RepID=UPI0009211131|nr:type II secretion system protein [Rhizobacter sp. OV335]SHN12151.1 MSHA pilin protein MshA [Rhizobacter sp. OV335]